MPPKDSPRSTAAMLLIWRLWARLQAWFMTLPGVSKVLIVLMVGFVALSLLNTFVQLLSVLVVLAAIAIALYGIVQVLRLDSPPQGSDSE